MKTQAIATFGTDVRTPARAHSQWNHVALSSLQALLALLFLFAGGMKLAMPLEELAKQAQLPGLLLRFIGVCEVAGALGLVLPGLFRTRQELTPLAAAGLSIIMVGATALTLANGPIAPALFPAIVGSLLVIVAYARRRPASRARS
jgi:uncharacterized membrane protein YphA (DoxX/SURF4 family)